MKTIAAVMMAIFLTIGMATAVAAGEDEMSPRKERNQSMLLDELEPYGKTVTTNNVSAKRVDNLYMLMGELEPYSAGPQRSRTSVREKTVMSPKKYNNLCMVCDEIE
jgi:hypothetical protein